MIPLTRTRTSAVAFVIAVAYAGGMPRSAYAATKPGDSRYAERLGELVNHYREQRGARPLRVDGALSALAREHSIAMAKTGRLSHDEFPSRVRRSGYPMCVENVGWNYPTSDAQFDSWRRSPGHDRNLLDARVAWMGIGVASDYVTFIACQ
jgi:uncharacterized protein YkwD